MARRIGAWRKNNNQHPQSARLQAENCCKNKSSKKNELTDQIFENVHTVNTEADLDPSTLRISLDTKATIKVGDFARGGKSRGLVPVKAADHDMGAVTKLTPGGILEPTTGQSFLFFTESNKTSDFIGDGIELWWDSRKEELATTITRIVINMDNGPECNGHRSQFLQRMVEFSDKTELEVHLIYYPPYHSKYNAIEHYWGCLERSWNGYLLNSVDVVLNRAMNFTWKTIHATVKHLTTTYEKGVKLLLQEKRKLEERLHRSSILSKYDILIRPKTVH